MIWTKLQDEDCYEPLKIMINDYVVKYGDRAIEELKLENQTFRDKVITDYLKDDYNLWYKHKQF